MPRDVVRELAMLLRYSEADGSNVGPFLAAHAGELAHLLQSDERELRAAAHERDGALVDRLRVRLDVAAERQRQLRDVRGAELAQRAARELARTARWFELGVALDVDVVLGALLCDPKTRFISFVLGDTSAVVPSALLRRARSLRRVHLDLACFVDDGGVHIRWKAGRGQLNFYAVKATSRSEREVLVVHLPRRVERRPVLVGDVLAELGFGS